jgi:hypothetical protein
VLLQHEHVDTLTGQQQPQHRPSRTAAGDAAGHASNVADLTDRPPCPDALPSSSLRLGVHVWVMHVRISLHPFAYRSPRTTIDYHYESPIH